MKHTEDTVPELRGKKTRKNKQSSGIFLIIVCFGDGELSCSVSEEKEKAMKLAPRERRQRSDYLVDNAAALQIGHLFLNWGKKRSKRKGKRGACGAEGEKKKPAPAKKAAAKERQSPPKKKPPAKKAAPPASTKASESPHAAPKPAGRPRKYTAPLPRQRAAQPQPSKAVAEGRVVQQRGRRPTRPPVIPKPVPTPAMPECLPSDPAGSVDTSPMVAVVVRTMNGGSFRLVLTADAILYELKRQILCVIAPATAAQNALQRLPMLVMNGRALIPDNATLRSLGFTATSTVYCFPEPS